MSNSGGRPPRAQGGTKPLHPRNPHRSAYDFSQLCQLCPPLQAYVYQTPRGQDSIDFADPQAVKLLNQALLQHSYGVAFWDIPAGYLCPPIPGRADYIHYLADLLARLNQGKVPVGGKIQGLDIGTGASCIYPIIGSQSYGWRFCASDIDPVSIACAEQIVKANPNLKGKVECRLQSQAKQIFRGIIKPGDRFDFTLCNPPFHASAEAASAGSQRKVRNLNRSAGREAPTNTVLNFGGQKAELWCEGGEIAFIRQMIRESAGFATQCLWFTTLVSKRDNLAAIKQALQQVKATQVEVIEMAQGQKVSRFVAWSFTNPAQQQEWRDSHWLK